MRLQADTESMDIKTGSGDIELEAGSRARQVRMVAGSGEIRLNLGHVEGASIVARTGSGELRIRGQEASGRMCYNVRSGHACLERRMREL